MKKCIAAVLIIIAVFSLSGCQSKNVFSQYLQYMGKPYEEISGGYEITRVTEGMSIATVQSEDIFGLPGEVQYFFLTGDEDDGIIDIVSWASTQDGDLTDEEIDTFVNGMVDTYGDYDKEELKDKSNYSEAYTLYVWKDQDDYNVNLMVYEDKDKISISFQRKELTE